MDEIETEKERFDCCGGCGQCIKERDVIKKEWMRAERYWTVSEGEIDSVSVLIVNGSSLASRAVHGSNDFVLAAVRPVIVLPKSAI